MRKRREAKTVAAMAVARECSERGDFRSRSALAMKPANQNSAVEASALSITWTWARRGKKRGANVVYGIMRRRVKSEVKMRKFTWRGEDMDELWLLNVAATDAARESVRRAKRACVARRKVSGCMEGRLVDKGMDGLGMPMVALCKDGRPR